MKTSSSFDISEALQQGLNDFHKSCGYRITHTPECINPVQTSKIPGRKVSVKHFFNILFFLEYFISQISRKAGNTK
jgi:hypothetical protein